MTKRKYIPFFILLLLIFSVSFCAFANAGGEDIYNNDGGVLCISHGGYSAAEDKNSPEAIAAAFSKGADMVSARASYSEGEMVLCDKNATRLSEAVTSLGLSEIIILDISSEDKNEAYAFIEDADVFENVFLRFEGSLKEINGWLEGKNEKLVVIPVCDSFNIFTVLSAVKATAQSELPALQLQSKNYFGVMYGSVCTSRYSAKGQPRAIAPCYDPDLCGQRSDSQDGWNELIKKSFSVIETNNLDAFIRYKENIRLLKQELSQLLARAEEIDSEAYSVVSGDNLNKAIENAKALLQRGIVSSDELEEAFARLMLSVEKLSPKTQEDTQTGALNITPGKVIAVLLVGAAILAAQIFTHKMQKEKKKK